ncbi:predicted protein [Streptomyces azureus]|uniref:Uncharacterized protein n=1 Tax=Streptomyces azureus TaxID=146537 RepID=A0A0K8PSI0_STRAJ|nr:predicted protein [Streptomyces azureus]
MLDRFCGPGCVAFSGTYVASDDLGPVVEGFLADSEPGFVTWSDPDDAQSLSEQTETEPEIRPFGVWVSSVSEPHADWSCPSTRTSRRWQMRAAAMPVKARKCSALRS